MPARRMLTMRHLRRIMRLHHEGLSTRKITVRRTSGCVAGAAVNGRWECEHR